MILGLDLGKKTGIAKAKIDLKIALPYKTVVGLESLANEVNDIKPDFLVVGLPLLLSGKEGLQCQRVRSMVGNLISKTYKMPVYYEDERFSTQSVYGVDDDDSFSAAWILQNYLNKI